MKKYFFLPLIIGIIIIIVLIFYFSSYKVLASPPNNNKYCTHFRINPQDVPIGLTAEQFCKDRGYDECFTAIGWRKGRLFNSEDLTCSGDIQMVYFNSLYETNCRSNGLGRIVTACGSTTENGYAEPFYGDMEETSSVDEVVCCNINKLKKSFPFS